MSLADSSSQDIIDETLSLFRANSLFRNFEIKGPADRLLIILILFVSDCLAKLGSARSSPSELEASKMLNTLAVDNFAIPGDANFPLNAHYAAPSSRAEAGKYSNLVNGQRDLNADRLFASVPHAAPPGACCTFS
jgi:actin related protein 2/3 complex, subunit 3